MALFQDVAYIILTDDNHWLLNEAPFNTKEFRDYVEICKKHIEEKIMENKQVVVKKQMLVKLTRILQII